MSNKERHDVFQTYIKPIRLRCYWDEGAFRVKYIDSRRLMGDLNAQACARLARG